MSSRVRIHSFPPLRMWVDGEEARYVRSPIYTGTALLHRRSRGYEARGCMWSPGYFHLQLARQAGNRGSLDRKLESDARGTACRRGSGSKGSGGIRCFGRRTVGPRRIRGRTGLAADQFVITPAGALRIWLARGPQAIRCVR